VIDARPAAGANAARPQRLAPNRSPSRPGDTCAVLVTGTQGAARTGSSAATDDREHWPHGGSDTARTDDVGDAPFGTAGLCGSTSDGRTAHIGRVNIRGLVVTSTLEEATSPAAGDERHRSILAAQQTQWRRQKQREFRELVPPTTSITASRTWLLRADGSANPSSSAR
jgi:hypothetical protein